MRAITSRSRRAGGGEVRGEQVLRGPEDEGERRPQLVAHVGEELGLQPLEVLRPLVGGAELVERRLELPVEPRALLLGLLALGDVPDRGDGEDAVRGLERREADLGGELGPVLPEPEQLEAPRAHGAGVRLAEVGAAVGGVRGAEPLRDEGLDALPEQLLAGVAEELLGLGVHEDDLPAPVGDHHRVGRRLEEAAELGLHLLARGDVADRGDGEHPVLGLERREADLGGELGPVLPQPVQLERTHRRPSAACGDRRSSRSGGEGAPPGSARG